jgi:hypothetical protein
MSVTVRAKWYPQTSKNRKTPPGPLLSIKKGTRHGLPQGCKGPLQRSRSGERKVLRASYGLDTISTEYNRGQCELGLSPTSDTKIKKKTGVARRGRVPVVLYNSAIALARIEGSSTYSAHYWQKECMPLDNE